MLIYNLLGIVIYLIQILTYLVIAQFVLSLLISFNVVNTHNDFVGGLARALETLLEPLYRPIRRLLPVMSGIDFSPMVLLILAQVLIRLIAALAESTIR